MNIKGGYEGYIKAVKEAFHTSRANPEIRWNKDNGFFMESGIYDLRDDDIRIGKAFYDLNNGGKRSQGSCKQYQEAREIIMCALDEI
jgi:hypothetical protein